MNIVMRTRLIWMVCVAITRLTSVSWGFLSVLVTTEKQKDITTVLVNCEGASST